LILLDKKQELIDIIEEMGAHNVRDRGDYIQSTCPVHEGDNPTAFSFIKPTGPWTCFTRNCHEGKRRDLYGLVKLCTGQTIKLDSDYQDEQETRKFIRNTIEEKKDSPESKVDTSTIPQIFLNRGISKEVLEEFGAGMVTLGYGTGRAALPMCDPYSGKILGWTMRALRDEMPKWKHTPGCPKALTLFGAPKALAMAHRTDLMILTEGPLDVMKCWTAGIKNVVALMGVSISSKQAEIIMANVNTVVVAMDGDEAGYKANGKITETLNSLGMRAIACNLPTNKDLGEEVSRIEQDLS